MGWFLCVCSYVDFGLGCDEWSLGRVFLGDLRSVEASWASQGAHDVSAADSFPVLLMEPAVIFIC